MNDIKTDNNQPLVELAFQYDETDELVKTCLQVNATEQEVDLSDLTEDEQTLRDECEAEIHDGIEAVSQVGYRLYQVTTGKLYRSTHRFFGEYCEEVLGISRVHANRQIEAYQTDETVKSEPIGSVSVPQNESQARTVANLTPKEKVKVAKKVKEKLGKGKPTTKDWQEARQEVIATKPVSKPPKVTKAANPKVKNDNVVSLPVQSAQTAMVLVQLPSEFYKPTCEIPSLTKLSEMARLHDNIKDNPAKKTEASKLARDLKTWLELYAKWEQKFLIKALEQEAQAA